jgi:hypothetical protein
LRFLSGAKGKRGKRHFVPHPCPGRDAARRFFAA